MPSQTADKGSDELGLCRWLLHSTEAKSNHPRKDYLIKLREDLKDAIVAAQMDQLRRLVNPELVCVWLTLSAQVC